MQRILYFLFTLIFLPNIYSQELIKPVFGNISQKEIDLKKCSIDSTANAVVLFDMGESKFIRTLEGFNIKLTRHKRIKILNKQGIINGEIQIPFYIHDNNEEEKIEDIEAYTYIEKNGILKKYKLDPKTIYTERINKWWKQKKFVFPNLKEGAIIEYKYSHETPFIFNLPDWEFQSNIPTLYSQYQVGMIPFYEYVRISQGINTLFIDKTEKGNNYSFRGIDYQELIYTSVMKNIKAFKDEAYITSKNSIFN